ncbi:hypothetical protein BaRGS_00008730, partial [Batillaria attramentaria]
WMNKMGLAAISFDTSQMVTTGGFIKPEPRGNHLGIQNNYYSESEEEGDESTHTPFGSALSLNSIASASSFATTGQASPPGHRRVVALASDPGSHSGQSHPHPPGSPQSRHEHHGSGKLGDLREVNSDSVEDLHSVLKAIHHQALTIDGVNRQARRSRNISSMVGGQLADSDNVRLTKMRTLLALERTLKVKEQEVRDIDRLLSSNVTSHLLGEFLHHHPHLLS